MKLKNLCLVMPLEEYPVNILKINYHEKDFFTYCVHNIFEYE